MEFQQMSKILRRFRKKLLRRERRVFFRGGGVKRFAININPPPPPPPPPKTVGHKHQPPSSETMVVLWEKCRWLGFIVFFQVRGVERNLISVEWWQISKAMLLEIYSSHMLSWARRVIGASLHWPLSSASANWSVNNGRLLSSTIWIYFPFGYWFSIECLTRQAFFMSS